MFQQTFYNLFKTTCLVDGSAFFGIHGTPDPMWDEHIDYVGAGPKLLAKIAQYGGMANFNRYFKVEVLYTSTSLEEVERRIKLILNPATLADPLCLNTSEQERVAKISETMTGQPKTDIHRERIAIAMQDNSNALGKVQPEEAKQAQSETRLKAKLKWIHNKTTREELQIPADELADGGMLTGFELGRLPKKLKKLGAIPPKDTTPREFY